MTDLSGIGSNLTFTNGIPPGAPYYYITAHLDLSGSKLPDNQDPSLTYYFNRDNNLSYLNTDVPYYGWHMVDSNAIIGDVVLYSNPDMVESGSLSYEVGGALFDPSELRPEFVDPVSAVWGGPTGFTSGAVLADDLKTGVVCFYGHEGGHELEELTDVNAKRHLAITIRYYEDAPLAEQKEELIVIPEEVILAESAAESADVLVAESVDVLAAELAAESAAVLAAESARERQRKKKEKADAVVNGRVVSHELLNQLRSHKALVKSRAPRVVVNPDIESGTVFVVVKVYPKQY